MLVTSMVCAGLLAGCGKKQPANSSESTVKESVTTSTETQQEVPSEPKELNVFAPSNSYVENINTNEFTLWYEEYSGVHVNWEIPSEKANDAFAMKIVGGDLPDVVYGLNFDIITRNVYGEDGVFIDLSDLIEEYAPNIKRLFEQYPELKESLTTEDGAIYGIPKINQAAISNYSYMLWVYEPWLEALNVDRNSIKTTEDLYNLYKLVAETDLNGNGKKDEIAFAARGVSGSHGILSYLMNCFTFTISSGTGGYLVEKDAGIEFVADTEEWREGLRFIHKLYNENLMLKDSISLDRTTLTSLGESETPILFSSVGLWAPYFTTNNSQRSTEFVALAPVESPSGYIGTPINSLLDGKTYMHITSACEDPITAIKWLDGLWDEEPAAKAGLTSVVAAEPGQIAINGEQALYMSPETVSAAEPNTMWGTFYMNWRDPLSEFSTYYENPNTHAIYVARAEGLEMYDPYALDKTVNGVILEGDESAEYKELHTAIQNVVVTNAASFITGEKSLDADWDAYVKELKDYGLERYLELVNKGYMY